MSGPISTHHRAIVGFVALVATLCALVILPAAQAKPKPASDYLALGDSLAYGYQAAKFGAEYPNVVPVDVQHGVCRCLRVGVAKAQAADRSKPTSAVPANRPTGTLRRSAAAGNGVHLRAERGLLRRSARDRRGCDLQQGVVARISYGGSQLDAALVLEEASSHQPDHA